MQNKKYEYWLFLFCLSSNSCYFIRLSSLRWSQLSVSGFLTKFCQNDHINLSRTGRRLLLRALPHIHSPAHHAPLVLTLILTRVNIKSILVLHRHFIKKLHINLLIGKTQIFSIYLSIYHYLSIYLSIDLSIFVFLTYL